MTKWKPDPVLKDALSSGPRMFAMIAAPLIQRFGDEAKKLIMDVVYQAGVERGKELAKLARNRDDLVEMERLNIESYNAKGYNTPGFDDPARNWIKRTPKHVIFDLSLCGGCESNIPQVYKEMGFDAKTIKLLGEVFCEPFDKGVRKGFNPKIELTFTKLATRGDPFCQWDEKIVD